MPEAIEIMLIFFLIFIPSLVLLLGLIYLFVLVRPKPAAMSGRLALVDYAHRGLHTKTETEEIPENSLAAFERACTLGVGIELDVQLSSDGEIMVFHDYSLSRMTGREEKLCELTAQELSTLLLGQSTQTIPTLSQVLQLVDGRVPLLIELKGESLDASLCQKLATLLRTYTGDYCIESFNPLLVRGMRKAMPQVCAGQLYTDLISDKERKTTALDLPLSLMAFNFLARPCFVAYNYHHRQKAAVRLSTRFYRAERFVWTVRDRADLEQAHILGEIPIFEGIEPKDYHLLRRIKADEQAQEK